MIDHHALKAWDIPGTEHTYTADDTMRYALALGIGHDPMDRRALRYVNDTVAGTPIALPTQAVVLAYPGSWMRNPATGIDYAQIVHGEESLVVHAPLPAAGTVRSRHRVISVVDKGAGRGAVITYEKQLLEQPGDRLLVTIRHTTFARGNGGYSARDGVTDAAPPPPAPVPTRAPDRQCEVATLPQQALLYRLCADRNPLHSDPDVARAAGFERPILHGLCTYGIAGRALLQLWADDEPARLRALSVRFTAPVIPGDTLRIESYREGAEIRFRARVAGSGRTVLDFGRAVIDPLT